MATSSAMAPLFLTFTRTLALPTSRSKSKDRVTREKHIFQGVYLCVLKGPLGCFVSQISSRPADPDCISNSPPWPDTKFRNNSLLLPPSVRQRLRMDNTIHASSRRSLIEPREGGGGVIRAFFVRTVRTSLSGSTSGENVPFH